MKVKISLKKYLCFLKRYDTLSMLRDVAQFGSAPGSGLGGRRFKSCRPDQYRFGPATNNFIHRGIAQFGSAPGLGPGGRRFESCCSDHFMRL